MAPCYLANCSDYIYSTYTYRTGKYLLIYGTATRRCFELGFGPQVGTVKCCLSVWCASVCLCGSDSHTHPHAHAQTHSPWNQRVPVSSAHDCWLAGSIVGWARTQYVCTPRVCGATELYLSVNNLANGIHMTAMSPGQAVTANRNACNFATNSTRYNGIYFDEGAWRIGV